MGVRFSPTVGWVQKHTEDVGGRVGFGAGWQELGEVGEVVASGDEGEFGGASSLGLCQTDGGREAVADALAAEGFFGGTPLAPIVLQGFGGAAVTNGAVRLAIEMA